ncbi:sugar transferase [Jannaschia sp. KMU-145]|uniref:sugar transferase n=1 Tax=Jannaschia halovivens TaxID=3388667 RepID=UPI00396B2327
MILPRRALDFGLALVLAVMLALPMLLIAALIWRQNDGPVFYRSERMRGPATAFTLWKFRTMRPDSHDTGVTGGHKSDRITPLGRLLRRTRLDELPQLWNVLRGDIAFVGPRPPLRRYVEMYPDLYARVLADPPGITGLASLVYAAQEERDLARCRTAAEVEHVYVTRSIPRKAALDLLYRRHRHLGTDLHLMLWTAMRLLPGRIRPRHRGRYARSVGRSFGRIAASVSPVSVVASARSMARSRSSTSSR